MCILCVVEGRKTLEMMFFSHHCQSPTPVSSALVSRSVPSLTLRTTWTSAIAASATPALRSTSQASIVQVGGQDLHSVWRMVCILKGTPNQMTTGPINLNVLQTQVLSVMGLSALPIARKSSLFLRFYRCLSAAMLMRAHP